MEKGLCAVVIFSGLTSVFLGTAPAQAIDEGENNGCEELYQMIRGSLIRECIERRREDYLRTHNGRRPRLGSPDHDNVMSCTTAELQKIDELACATYAECKAAQNHNQSDEYKNMVFNWCMAGEFTK